MATNQQFNLRWNNHTNNILQVFLEQFSSETLVDVTLSCQGRFLRAHKMVLSACSPYFQDLFQVHQVQHPVIIMNGMKFEDVKQIIEFMYKGEIKVLEAELGGLLAAAETLQVKGLSNVRNKYQKGEIQGAGNPVNTSSEPPPLEPCSSNPNPNPPSSIPSSTPASALAPDSALAPALALAPAPAQAVSQTKPEVQSQAKPLPAVPPLAPTSTPAAAPLLQTTRLLIPAAQSTKRKKSPEAKSKTESPVKKRNFQTVSAVKPAASTPDKNTCDDEFPAMIKVEPLDIRDIDEEEPWEPPKLVIDMRADGSKANANAMTFNTVKPSLLKIRPAADLVTPRGDDPLKENEPKTEPLDGMPKEWRGNKRVTRIPRPPNAFMIFANEWRRKLAMENPSDSNKDISVRLGIKWKNLSAEKKALYYSASRIADEEHKRKYPNYYYSPKEARLRKSQQQSLRRRFAVERLNNAASTANTEGAKPITPDPLRFVKVFMKDPSTRGMFVAVDSAKTPTAATTSASNESVETSGEANLEEEFLKMVEEGDVEAEVEGDMSEELEGLTDHVEEEEIDSDTDTKPVLTDGLLLLQRQAEEADSEKAQRGDSNQANEKNDTTEGTKREDDDDDDE